MKSEPLVMMASVEDLDCRQESRVSDDADERGVAGAVMVRWR